ncbi:MAG: hypothetical protein HC853_12405 [Anaerolineae bacterium]|nr:hypothetical protein [Anaerolineae bacterium]
MASTTFRSTQPNVTPKPHAASSQAARVTSSEWRFVLGVIAFVLVFTSLPFAYAYLSASADKQFMGIMLDVPDHGQYFSWMRELTYAPLSSNKLTPEPQPTHLLQSAVVWAGSHWWVAGCELRRDVSAHARGWRGGVFAAGLPHLRVVF